MALADVIKKVIAKEDLTEEDIASLSGFDDFVAAEQAKANAATGKVNGILGEKKDAQAKLTEALARIDEMESAGLTAAEKAAKETEKILANNATLTVDLEAERKNHAATQREHAIDGIHAGQNWNRDVLNAGDSRQLLSNALASVEDLSDKDAVEAAVTQFKADRGTLFLAKVPVGTGTKGTTQAAQPGAEITPEQVLHIAQHGTVAESDAAFAQIAQQDAAATG